MFINRKLGELNLKVVYYGPAFSGKTTNLEMIYQNTPQDRRGEMVSLKTRGDRTLFFDYFQMELPPIRELKPKFNLYTVPGQVEYTTTRRLVLQGADGVIFVADSRSGQMQENIQSLIDLYKHLKSYGVDPRQVSLTLQFNKRDMEDAMPVDAMRQAMGISGYSIPCFEAAAVRNQGVSDTLKASIRSIIMRLDQVST
jgi:signal recognition particle receptor subunit beta